MGEAAQGYRHILRSLYAAVKWQPRAARNLVRLYKTHYREHPHPSCPTWKNSIVFLSSAAHSPKASLDQVEAWRREVAPLLAAKADALVSRGTSFSQVSTHQERQAQLAAAMAAYAHQAAQEEIRELKARARRRAGAEALVELGVRDSRKGKAPANKNLLQERISSLEDQAAKFAQMFERRSQHDHGRATRTVLARLGDADPVPSQEEIGLPALPPALQAVMEQQDPWTALVEAPLPPFPHGKKGAGSDSSLGGHTLAHQVVQNLSLLTFYHLSRASVLSRRKGGGTDMSHQPSLRNVHLQGMKERQEMLVSPEGETIPMEDQPSPMISDDLEVDESAQIHLPLLVVPPRLSAGLPKALRALPAVRGFRRTQHWMGQKVFSRAGGSNAAGSLAKDQAELKALKRTLHHRIFFARESHHIFTARNAMAKGHTHSVGGDKWDERGGALPWESPFVDYTILGWDAARIEAERTKLIDYYLSLSPADFESESLQRYKDFRTARRAYQDLAQNLHRRILVSAVEQVPKDALAGLVRDAEREAGVVLGSERFRKVSRNEWVEP